MKKVILSILILIPLSISQSFILTPKNTIKKFYKKRKPTKIKVSPSVKVTATVYHADPKQCNADFLTTASMFAIDSLNQYKHRILAISRDLKKYFEFGDTVLVEGTKVYDGVWYVEDVMNSRYQNTIDFLINKEMPIGKWKNVRIKKHR